MAVELEKTRSIKSTFRDYDGEPEEILNDSFLEKYTTFSSFSKFVHSFKGRYQNQSNPFNVTVEDADRVVHEETEFDSWFQMLEKAVEEWWAHPDRNRREHPRYSCNVDVHFKIGEQDFKGTMLDISRSGLCVTTGETIPNSRIAQVTVPLDAFQGREGLMRVRGAVRWRESDPSSTTMGLEIMSKESF